MRHLMLALACVWCAPLAAQIIKHPPRGTVAELKTCNAARNGNLFSVTDGTTATDCATGGEAVAPETVVCQCSQTSLGVYAWEATSSGGAASNSFETHSAPAGTSPVASSSTDTLTWLATSPITITGDSGADSMTVAIGDVPLGSGTSGGYAASTTEGGGATSLEADAIDATTELAGSLCGTGEILEDGGPSWSCVTTPPGDMTKAVYDADDDGLVDRSEEVVVEARKDAAGTINAGDVVGITGYNTGIGVSLVECVAAGDSPYNPAIGIAMESFTNGTTGRVVTKGTLSGLDTSAWSVGDGLWVSTTSCQLTNTRPTGSTNAVQKVGIVIRSNVSVGAIDIFGAGRSNDVPNIASANFWLGNGSGVATAVTMSGDATMDNTGAVTLSSAISGPVSSTDLAIATWSGTGGDTLLDNSGVTISSGEILLASGKKYCLDNPCTSYLYENGSTVLLYVNSTLKAEWNFTEFVTNSLIKGTTSTRPCLELRNAGSSSLTSVALNCNDRDTGLYSLSVDEVIMGAGGVAAMKWFPTYVETIGGRNFGVLTTVPAPVGGLLTGDEYYDDSGAKCFYNGSTWDKVGSGTCA